MTLLSDTAYHSFIGEVEALNTTTIRRLTRSRRHQLLAIAPSLTASVIGNSCRLADRRVATRASRESSGKAGVKAPPHRGNRVRDVAFGFDRWRLWFGNLGDW